MRPRLDRLSSAVRWALLVDALVLASAALLTTPVAGQDAGHRGVACWHVLPEIALWLVWLVWLPWAGHAFDLVHFNTPGARIARHAIVRFLASITR